MNTEDQHSIALPFPIPTTMPCVPHGRVAVFAPHPDDEAIGCGGALALHRRAGDPVRVLVVTDGRAGNVQNKLSREEYVACRRRECEESANVLGGLDFTFWDFPDSCVITDNDMNHVAALAADWLRADMPDVVYAPWTGEGNTDHAAVGAIARRALRAAGFRGTCYGYEVYCPGPADVVLDITEVAGVKRSALQKFISQLADTPIDHFIFGLNASRALFLPKGSTHGEAFVTWRAPSGT